MQARPQAATLGVEVGGLGKAFDSNSKLCSQVAVGGEDRKRS